MEQWGLITYSEGALGGNTSAASAPVEVVSHELAHQWFGNLVTVSGRAAGARVPVDFPHYPAAPLPPVLQAEWWDCLWINEGFATFWSKVQIQATAPQWAPDGPWRYSVQGAMEDDGYAFSQALTVGWPIATAAATEGTFTGITYNKGSAVIAGIARRLDAVRPGSFIAGLRAFLGQYAYASARPADLVAALSAAASLPGLAAEVNAPLYLPGVPLLRVEPLAAGGTGLSLSVTRFFVSSASEAKAAAAGQALTPWAAIPLAISAASPSAALSAAAAAATAAVGGLVGGTALPATLPYLPSSDGWVLVTNSSAADYVRVLYPPENYVLIGAALSSGSPPPAFGVGVRAALVDDLFAAASARTAWQSAAGAPSVNMSFALAWAASWMASEQSGIVRSVLAAHLGRLQQLVVDDIPFESCGNASVVPRAAIPGTSEYACSAALRAYASTFGIALRTFTTDRGAMAATLAGPLTPQNASGALSSVAANPFGRDIAWAAFKAGATTYAAWYGAGGTLSGLAQGLAVNLHSTSYANDEEAVWTGLGASASITQGYWQRGVERIVAGAGWYAADVDSTCSFLVSGWGSGEGADGGVTQAGPTPPLGDALSVSPPFDSVAVDVWTRI